MIKQCAICGEPFNAYHKSLMCCSRKCGGIYKRTLKQQVCSVCGNEFRPHSATHRFCSRKCADRAQLDRVTVPCLGCGKPITQKRSAPNRYCSLSCYAKHQKPKGCATLAKRPASQILSPLSPFMYYCANTRRNSARISNVKRGFLAAVTPASLLGVWNAQNGVCVYTGWSLLLPRRAMGFDNKEPRTRRASVDRLDSSIGYTPTNVQFTCMMANFAKSDLPVTDMFNLCKSVVDPTLPCPYHGRTPEPKRWIPGPEHLFPYTALLTRSRIGAVKRGIPFAITIEDIYAVAKRQNYRCAYTNWPLAFPGPKWYTSDIPKPIRASIDRKDSSKDYTPDNIQIISLTANQAKNNFTEAEFRQFCAAVCAHNHLLDTPTIR